MNLTVIAFRTTKLKSFHCYQHVSTIPKFLGNKHAVCIMYGEIPKGIMEMYNGNTNHLVIQTY